MRTNCIFSNYCQALLCPMQTREKNIIQYWYPGMPMCQLKKGIPFWVKQQRRIEDRIKFKNRMTVFDLFMLEAPLKVTSNVKGVVPIQDQCRVCSTIDWFMENQLPAPDELDKYHHQVEGGIDEDQVEEEGQTVH